MTAVAALPAYETIGTEQLHRLGWRDGALWGMALVLVLTLQAIGVFALSTWRDEPEIPGAPPPAIMIELSEISVAPQVEDIAAEDGELALPQEPAQAVEPIPVEPVETAEPVTEPVLDVAEAVLPEPIPDSVAEPVTPDEVPPEEAVEPEPVEEIIPDLVEAEDADVFVPMPRQLPATLEQKRRELAKAQQTERLERDRQEQEREQRQREQRRKQQQAAAASQQTAPRSVEAEAADKAAANRQTVSKRTPSVSPQKWQGQVIAQLNRMKRYPADARRRMEQGVPHLQFTIDRAGRVLSARIVRSSGFPALDQAALDMVNRASPLPAPPASIPDTRITLTVPVNFNLR